MAAFLSNFKKLLLQSEQPFSVLADIAPVHIWIDDENGGSIFANARYREFAGPDQELPAKRLDLLHPDDCERYLAGYRDAQMRRVEHRTIVRLRRYDGEYRWFEVLATPRLENDRLTGYVGVHLDISEHKHAEDALHFLVSLHDTTRGVRDRAKVEGEIVTHIGRHFRVSRCAYAEVDTAQNSLTITRDYTDGVKSAAGRHLLNAFGPQCLQALRDGQTLSITDLQADTRTRCERAPVEFAALQIRAILCVPLRQDGRLAALCMLHHHTPREWSAAEVELLEQVAERTWYAIENARAEAALRESRDVLSLAMRGGRMGAWARDMVTNQVWWSRELEEIFGLPKDGFLGTEQGFFTYVHEADRTAMAQAIEDAVTSHTDYVLEFRFLHASGEWRWMEGRGRAVYGSDEQPVMLYGLGIDITERRRAVDALRDSDRRKDEFLATLAHELRNPLAPIRIAVALMRKKEPGDPEVRAAQDIIDRQVRQMTRLVDDLLDLARITQGKIQLRKEPVPLQAVVHDAVEVARPLISASEQILRVTLPPLAESILFDGDPTRLAQILQNLLTNAAKYTPKGGHIWLSVECSAQQAELSVRDDGIGIAAEHLPHLFEMFSQVAPALERTQGGLGIGLWLVRGLVELHGGSVSARSAGLGQGSEFTVRLPLVASQDTTATATPPSAATKERSQPNRVRILIVDDNRDAADTLDMMLRLMGYEVHSVHDGLAAVQAAESFGPQVVLLDIGLPKMNGYEAARHIRQQPWGKHISLIALTGWGQEDDKRRAIEAGFDAHLTKPMDPAQLEALLQSLLVSAQSSS